MGLLDILKKLADIASDSKSDEAKTTANPQNKDVDTAPAHNTPQDIINSGNTPAKPSVLFKDEFGDKEFTFMISGDFIEFNSHCEVVPSFQYEPFNDDDYTSYNEMLPQIGIGPNDDIYDAVEEFEENGSLPNESYEKCDNKFFAFRCTFNNYGRRFYAYGFRKNTARELEMLSIEYNPDIVGTPLEKKLMAALDEIASTYSETNI